MDSSDVSIETYVLKSRLNDAYVAMRSRGQTMSTVSHFQDLWDLKEQALIERKKTVTVPSGWLYQVEHQVGTVSH